MHVRTLYLHEQIDHTIAPVSAFAPVTHRRQHLATKGSTATCRWLPSVLVSPDHLKVPRARIPKGNSTVKGVTLGVSCHADAGGVGSQPRGILMGTGNTAEELEIVGGERRREIEEIKKRRRFLVEERKRTRPKELDGFMLMDACGCELPDEGRRADVSGRGLVRAVQEDMAFFIRLQTLDAGDNSVPFETFMGLPRLEELRVPCNGIRDFSLKTGGYSELRRLDLSYNNICGDAMSLLARLPNLIDLDLTCNGLTDLPRVTNSFPRLQKLSLERNQLESQAVMDVRSSVLTEHRLHIFSTICLIVDLVHYNSSCRLRGNVKEIVVYCLKVK